MGTASEIKIRPYKAGKVGYNTLWLHFHLLIIDKKDIDCQIVKPRRVLMTYSKNKKYAL